MSENEEVVAVLASGVLEDSGGLVEHSDQRDSVFVSHQRPELSGYFHQFFLGPHYLADIFVGLRGLIGEFHRSGSRW